MYSIPAFDSSQSSPCPTIGGLNEADWYRRPSATWDVDGGVTKALDLWMVDLSMEEVDTRFVCGMTCAVRYCHHHDGVNVVRHRTT